MMSYFYGTVQGNRGEATRCGSMSSGMKTYCASWDGAIRCYAYEKDGKDMVLVEMVSWQGKGEYKLLYHGEMGKFNPKEVYCDD